MTAVDLEYAHKLATTLMWKRFGDEKPTLGSNLVLKKESKDGRVFTMPAVLSRGWSDELIFVCWGAQVEKPYCSDLWIYLSDLDILRVKGEG